MPLFRLLIVFCIIAALTLCLAWQETMVRHERRKLHELNVVLENRSANVKILKSQVARLKSPQRILRIVQEMNMELMLPTALPSIVQKRITPMENLGLIESLEPQESDFSPTEDVERDGTR